MNIDPCKAVIALAGLVALSGCTQSLLEEPGDSTFGEANRQTMMAQIVDPEPVYDQPMTTSGENAANAVERYRKGTVKEPAADSTTQGSSGSGPQ